MPVTASKPLHQPLPDRSRAALTPGGHRVSTAFWVLGTGLALGAAALLPAARAQAQTPPPSAAPVVAPVTAPAKPKYTVAQIAQAFAFIDSNKNGKLSREEAAGFRGVARHFDKADTNKDGELSRKEFEKALSGEKPR
ncbi:MAG: EF-hand domain-containing protein [Pseudomonadota bacterium]|uniref:EF-hand domain-containing protein n=1 Tax=Polaromonas sp. TaxID=1869339 RepID=UPI0018040A1A|nr:EF-hand domain-containing protein [Polaromonas sp.]MBA3595117.1 EF-hand domain-containing protein [Polaromonas sp.]MDQ3271953.1 EF-hand domain-containing protein [Pseudomonadota bacterium]